MAESLGLDPDRVAFFPSLRPLAGLSAGEWEQPGVLAAAGLTLERLEETGSGMRLFLPGEKEPPGRREFLSWPAPLVFFGHGAYSFTSHPPERRVFSKSGCNGGAGTGRGP